MKRPELSSLVKELRALSVPERISALAEAFDWSHEERALLLKSPSLPHSVANQMVENSIGVLGIPLGLAGPFWVNGHEKWVPMATEEPSVIAAASLGAKLAAQGDGFVAEADEPMMVAQVQLLDIPDAQAAAQSIVGQKKAVLEWANRAQPGMQQRGGGARDVEVFPHRLPNGAAALGVHLLVDVRDAMGANVLNFMAEAVAPLLETCSGGRAGARILSNFADRRRVRARCALPVGCLETQSYSGERIAQGIVELSLFAEASVHRAVTHNKGIMNGIDAVALATGNDFRAIEAGAHAWASREGRYRPLATW
ncbi:MAG: 3-hydroxy-3-methylglutaryl-CoA reductase, partial [Alphaproteobacteria bacterium]|nr:3-hydroxy-3-methylglutaryl-CoA reductase [Alphaproteobacteria bacterium]